MQLALDELNEDDIVVESQGVKVVYDATIKQHVSNSVIDYSTNAMRPGFYITKSGGSCC